MCALDPITLASVAEVAGVSEDAASRHIGKLVEAGVLRKDLRFEPESVDPESGEVIPPRRRQYLGLAEGGVLDFVSAVAALQPEKPKTWGGRADRCKPCPDHPTARVVKRTITQIVYLCDDCGRELGRDPESVVESRNGVIAGNPQDAESGPAGVENTVANARISPTVRFSSNHAETALAERRGRAIADPANHETEPMSDDDEVVAVYTVANDVNDLVRLKLDEKPLWSRDINAAIVAAEKGLGARLVAMHPVLTDGDW